MTLSIRPATPEDTPALRSIDGGDAGYFERCFELQAADERQLLLAEADGRAAGYVIYNRAPRYALYRKLGIPEIQDLIVAPASRRAGIGRALVDHCEHMARGEGHAEIGIAVGLHAAFGAAQRLYIKMGYVPDGFGITYDRESVTFGDIRPIDDDLCLMMVKTL